MTFSDFWTNKNNPILSKYLYNTRHILFLVGTVVAIIILSLIFRKKSEKAKKILFYVLGSILLFFEISSRVVNFIVKENLTFEKIVKIILPMHICSVMVWVFIVAIFTNNKVLKNFACVGGLLATIVFLLYPSVGLNRVYMTFDCLYSTLSHCVGFICAILMITLKRTDFDIKKMWQTYACFGVMFSWGGVLNFIIFPGENYMYFVEDPIGLNLPIPFQIPFFAFIIFYISLFYLIPYIKNKIVEKSKQKQGVILSENNIQINNEINIDVLNNIISNDIDESAKNDA